MWLDELTKIRRYLRDPDGNIWSEAYLRHTWNDVQKDFQHKTSILEDAVAQRVPDLYHCAYLQDWEWQYLPSIYSEFYQALRRHDGKTYCYNWEPQEIAGITSDTSEWGAHFTQPWEAYMVTPGEEVRMKFPKNFRNVKFMAYDDEPIDYLSRKEVQSYDSSFITNSGTPRGYYEYEAQDKSYVLYPRPSTAFIEEISGEGIAFYVESDSEDTTVGTIAIRTASGETGYGAAVDVVGTASNVFLVYDVDPRDVDTLSSDIDFPDYMTKYIRFGVLAKAYMANTDGKIASLAKWWSLRYDAGVQTVKKFMGARKQDRNYKLSTHPVAAIRRRRRLPRLPSTYPRDWV